MFPFCQLPVVGAALLCIADKNFSHFSRIFGGFDEILLIDVHIRCHCRDGRRSRFIRLLVFSEEITVNYNVILRNKFANAT